MNPAWKRHWPENLMEAAELGLFMISACFFVVLLEHPSSPVRQAIPSAFLRRVLMGLAMGTTAISIIFSPLGRRSGAHFNPAVTMTFWRLKKVSGADALAYVLFQFAGGAAGFAAEVAISFILMSVVLAAMASTRLARFTGIFAGCLVSIFITFEAPISG